MKRQSLAGWLSLALLIAASSGCASTPIHAPAIQTSTLRAPTLVPTVPTLPAPSSLTRLTMGTPRAAHTATLLADGRILIVGGFRGNEETIGEAELFDPALGAFRLLGPMLDPRVGHTATRLQDGRVLIVGGWSNHQRVDTVEIFDPATETFKRLGRLNGPRADHTATLLADGRVLIAGGFEARNAPRAVAEVFDPRANIFTPVGALGVPRSGHTATLLADGRVLIAGGTLAGDKVTASLEIFDPASNVFTAARDLAIRRRKHAAVMLADGRVLIVGGTDERDWAYPYDSTEIYNPATGALGPGPRLNASRFKLADAVVALGNGDVLVGGGAQQIEILDPRRMAFGAPQKLDADYFFSTATVLADGGALIAGGYDRKIQATASAWLYR
ncbi:MAG: hypothetical protein KAX36_07730 [Thermoflexales bacterium]|nr:hypothetical protein [Thermoflexales bacterium]